MTENTSRLLALIGQDIENIDLPVKPPELYQPIRYMLDMGGKRLRPLLVLLAYGLYRDDPEKIVSIANTVEIFHNFTLMHDDIMDDAPLRRGKPSVHEKWDQRVGILSGDVMLVKAYERLQEVDQSKFYPVLKAFNQCAAEVCEGQQLDMNFESNDRVSEDDYLEMIRLKTAVLVGFSLELGAILADAPVNQRRLLKDFGINIGLGFQLKDDLLDVYGDQSKFGKQVGGDIISNKKTYLLIKALETATDSLANKLTHWLGKKNFVKSEKVIAVTAIYDELEIKKLAQQKMDHYFQTAFTALDQLDLSQERSAELRSFTDSLIHRDR